MYEMNSGAIYKCTVSVTNYRSIYHPNISVAGFTSPLLGNGLSTGPTVLWIENAETVDVVLAGSFIYNLKYKQ